MSIWRYVFDNELVQRMDIEALERRAHRAQMTAVRSRRAAAERIEGLEQQVGELALLCRALVNVLQAHGGITPEALQTALAAIDAEDGVIDGRVTPPEDRPAPPRPPATPHPTPQATPPWKRRPS